jgi:TonB family protein
MLPSDIPFKANPAERWSPSRASLAEPSLYLALLGVGLVYAAMLSLLFFDYQWEPALEPAPEAIPIEIVLEPPPQKEPDKPAPKPEPTPPAQPIAEEPATDAPRAANNEKKETELFDKIAKTPAAPPPPAPPNPEPDPGKASGPTKEPEPLAKDKSAAPVADKPAPEDPIAELNREKLDEAVARADAEAKIDKPKPATVTEFPPFESVPDFDFESLAKQTLVAGGNAKSTYLSVLYGMVMPHMHLPPGIRANASKIQGTIVFGVDGRGNITQRRVVQQSGSHELDAAALQAIGEAAPFPAPPQGAPIEMRFTYGAK